MIVHELSWTFPNRVDVRSDPKLLRLLQLNVLESLVPGMSVKGAFVTLYGYIPREESLSNPRVLTHPHLKGKLSGHGFCS